MSAAFAALVIAVEALIPGPSGRKSAEFKKFVNELVPNAGASYESPGRLYGLRADLLHGSTLIYSDRDPLSIGITPAMTQSSKDFHDMRRITKTVLVNWLETKSGAQASDKNVPT